MWSKRKKKNSIFKSQKLLTVYYTQTTGMTFFTSCRIKKKKKKTVLVRTKVVCQVKYFSSQNNVCSKDDLFSP